MISDFVISDFGFVGALRLGFMIADNRISESYFFIVDKKELQERLKKLAISIVHFAEKLPDSLGFRTVRNQIVRSGPSVAANYRAACRAKSKADFISKMGTVEEELDETQFWLEFTVGLSNEYRTQVAPLWKEADELMAIVVRTIVSTNRNHPKR